MTARHFIIFSHHFLTISPPLIRPWSDIVFRPLPALQDGKEERKGLLFGQVLWKLGLGQILGRSWGGKVGKRAWTFAKTVKTLDVVGKIGGRWFILVGKLSCNPGYLSGKCHVLNKWDVFPFHYNLDLRMIAMWRCHEAMTQKKQKQGELPCSVKIGNAHQHILQAALPTPRVRPPSLSMDIGGKNVVQQCEVHGNNKKKHEKPFNSIYWIYG